MSWLSRKSMLLALSASALVWLWRSRRCAMDEVIEFPKSEAQLAAERMRAVERQIHRYVPPGVRRSIRCPYCNALNFHEPGGLFCCDTLRHAVVTVLVADRALAAAEAGEKQIVH